MNEIALGTIGVGIAFLVISKLLGPFARWTEDIINRWLCWREIRRAVRR